MDEIILVRHGEHKNDILTDEGRAQIRSLAEKLKPFIDKNKIVKIFSSNYTRTIMSAEFIKQLYKLDEITKLDMIGEDDFDEDKIYEFIKNELAEVDIIILATHVQHVRFLPEYFSMAEWGKVNQLDEIKTGEAVIIDSLEQKITHLKR